MSKGTGFTDGMKSSLSDNWTTPPEFFAKLNEEFLFSLDAAALKSSTLVPGNWFGPDHDDSKRRDALVRDWGAASYRGWIWLNPPYGREISKFMAKANEEVKKGANIVALVPARTDTRWWWDSVIMHEVRFVRGRLKFSGSKQFAPFPNAVVVMRGTNE